MGQLEYSVGVTWQLQVLGGEAWPLLWEGGLTLMGLDFLLRV